MEFNTLRYQDPRTQTYLGSPSIVRLPDGALLASHDYFGPGCPRNHENEEHLTSLYRSEDDGASWRNITHVANAYWSTLFVHKGAVYLFGVTQQYGSIVIRRSDDGGFTWTHPADAARGLLVPGGAWHEPPNFHCAPVPVLFAHGRIYRAFEDLQGHDWGGDFQALVLSAPQEADLLDARSWTVSNRVAFPAARLPRQWPKHTFAQWEKAHGWLEGNLVAAPDGQLWNILRFHSAPVVNYALRLHLTPEGRTLTFVPEEAVLAFPGGMHKFTIRQVGAYYAALVNPCQKESCAWQRNVLALSVSRDLKHWEVVRTLLTDDHETTEELSLQKTGFQYVDWFREGGDLIYLVRTAYDGAHNFHDSNRITFHRAAGIFAELDHQYGGGTT